MSSQKVLEDRPEPDGASNSPDRIVLLLFPVSGAGGLCSKAPCGLMSMVLQTWLPFLHQHFSLPSRKESLSQRGLVPACSALCRFCGFPTASRSMLLQNSSGTTLGGGVGLQPFPSAELDLASVPSRFRTGLHSPAETQWRSEQNHHNSTQFSEIF